MAYALASFLGINGAAVRRHDQVWLGACGVRNSSDVGGGFFCNEHQKIRESGRLTNIPSQLHIAADLQN